MKQALITLLRALVIFVVGVAGLCGLLLSACGGLSMLGDARNVGGVGLLLWGLCAVAAAVGCILWLSKAGNRAVVIAFLVLFLPLLARLAYKALRH